MPRDYRLEAGPFEQVRRREYAQDETWMRAFLEQAQVGYLASHWDEQPFITPLTFWFDPEKREIYFHTNFIGRTRANLEQHPQVCFTAVRTGRVLPSNIALEFSIQYESVVAFGTARVLTGEEEAHRALYGLIEKYFPAMEAGHHFRPITEGELKRTAVFAVSIERWSGKRNWAEQADQSEDWPPLPPEMLG